MVKRFNVVFTRNDGGVELYPMKEWLRQHPDQIPPSLDPSSSTSHQLRNGLRKLGWQVEETDSEVRLAPPHSSLAMVGEVLGDGENDEYAGSQPASFALEYQLRDFLAQNLEAIPVENRRLKLYVDPTGRDGIEFPTAVGPIDILAVDDAGAFFVFELKRAQSPDAAIGQLTRYMGWVKQTIGRSKHVHGVIVAKSISDRLRYAASVIPYVSLFEYEVEFHLRAAEALSANASGTE